VSRPIDYWDHTGTGRRPDHGREPAHRAVEGSPNPSTDDIEHGPIFADSRRSSSLARCEFLNDPEADASCSQDRYFPLRVVPTRCAAAAAAPSILRLESTYG